MTFRYARHTNNLEEISRFYHDFLGLEILGEFKDHDNYNGLFFGKEGLDWHLEFTSSDLEAIHKPNADDLLVFYLDFEEEKEAMREKASKMNYEIITSENPYWQRNGIEVKDPDGFGVILTTKLKLQPIFYRWI